MRAAGAEAAAELRAVRRFSPLSAGLVARQLWLVTLVASVVVITVGRVGPDWPAQEFRAWLARDVGLSAWNDAWYGGHALPGYSVLYPPIATALGAGLTGLCAATLCAWAATRLFPTFGAVGPRTTLALNTSVALGVLGNLLIGQVPFLLGVALALLAILASNAGHPLVAALCAAGASLGSPLAGAFLILAATGWIYAGQWRRAVPFAAAALGSVVAWLVGGSSGPFPFDTQNLVTISVFSGLALVLAPRRLTALRAFILVYAAAAAVLCAIPNPVGGNLVRLGELIAVPLAIWCFAADGYREWRVPGVRPVLFAASIGAAIAWQVTPAVTAVARSAGDPSGSQQYYAGLLRFLSTQQPADGRLEIPFTREHWEALYVAPHFPIARGWERQLDIKYNEVLYHPLTAASYRAWLDASGVALIALPKAPLDYGGVAERALLARPPRYLRLAYRDPNWTVYRVAHASPLLTGADAQLVHLGVSSFTVRFRRAGTATVKIHDSALWDIAGSPTACIAASSDGWLHVRAAEPQTVKIRARVTLDAVLQQPPSPCPSR